MAGALVKLPTANLAGLYQVSWRWGAIPACATLVRTGVRRDASRVRATSTRDI